MKKIYHLFTLLLGISAIVNGQVFLEEDFSENVMPPAGWTIDGYSNQWSISATDNAGGEAPEGKFTWINVNSSTRFISPSVDLTGISSVVLSYKHFLNDYSGNGYTIGLATRSNAGDWNTIWSVNPTGDIGPEELLFSVENDDVGSSDFQFCIFIEGNFYNLDYYYIDNISLSARYELDGKMDKITTPTYLDGPAEVTGIVKSIGAETINSVTISWQANDGDVFSTLFDGLNMEFGDSFEFSCDDLFDYPIGSYELSVWIENVNGAADDNPDNNILNKTVNVVSHTVHRRPCIEEFTSSTCGPCATLNSQFVPWCDTHADDISLLKYQVDWPGSGDPYYTQEAGDRVDYYGVSGVPALFFNGSYKGYQFAGVQPAFDEAMAMPGLMSLVASHTFSGTEVSVDATILPYAGFDNAKVLIAVFEYTTTENATSNGETEFKHVMMKMIPGSAGTAAVLSDRVPFNVSETIDLAGTNVEEWDDLGVIVFVQDDNTQEVHQSDYSVEEGVFATNAYLLELYVNGVLLEGFDPDIFDYDIILPEGTTEVPVVDAVSSDPNAQVIIEPATELNGSSTFVDVFAEDLNTHNRYTITFNVATGIDNTTENMVKLYPNPTSGLIHIQTNSSSVVSIYATDGSLQGEYKLNNSEQIDLSYLSNGIYFIKIHSNDEVITKKISLNK